MQGSEFAHLLISLKSNEQLWAICSDRSRQMSDREWIAQVAQRKWATMSDPEQITQVAQDNWATMSHLLRSLRGNEQMSASLKKFWLKKSKILFYYVLLKV